MTTKNENVAVVDDWECIDDSEVSFSFTQMEVEVLLLNVTYQQF